MKQILLSDLNDLAIGASILGSGGGGSPVYDLMAAKQQIASSGPITLLDIDEVDPDGLVAPIGYMGAPLVGIEKIHSGREFEAILSQVEKTTGKKVSYLVSSEIGGSNALPPLMVSARLGIPVIDGDTTGRAFPELQMSCCTIKGIPVSPAFLADMRGNVYIVNASDDISAENECRALTMEMGSSSALCSNLMTGKQAKECLVPHSVSKAIAIGRTMRWAKKAGENPVDALLHITGGILIDTGVIVDINQAIQQGFLEGDVTISTNNGTVRIAYQNEFLVAYLNEIPVASTPDILTLIETETGTPISSESLLYGLRISLVVIPAPDIWKTPEGLALTGPKVFGYPIDYLDAKASQLIANKSTLRIPKKTEYVIGIDIGGTNTDAVLVDQNLSIVANEKATTTLILEKGVEIVLEKILEKHQVEKSRIHGVFVGSTYATNAIIEQQGLYTVGVIRIAGHRPDTIDCCAFWPEDLREKVFVECIHIDGGFECDGRPITPFSAIQAKDAAKRLKDKGAQSIAIVGVFSPIAGEQEKECGALVLDVLGKDFPLSLSHQIGGIGFIERENATILNCALKRPIGVGFRNLENVKNKLGLTCPLWITQNDGSIINLDQAIEYPLLTVSSGPTNSFIGASKLTDLSDAVVVDIGGTSTDIGMICNGYPKRSIHNVRIGGVDLNFRMPDVLAMAIGGGSYVKIDNKGTISIGPKSCGKNLIKDALVFGGTSLTLTDVACHMGCLDIPAADISHIHLNSQHTHKVIQLLNAKIQEGVRIMKGHRANLPVIVVGGAAPILANPFTQKNRFIIPPYYEVANAFGAALAEVSATIDTVVSLENRHTTLERLKEEALQFALRKGAHPNKISIVDLSIMPYHYMPNQLARVIVKASGARAGAISLAKV